jgi:trehalose 6-phosphate phosphatase
MADTGTDARPPLLSTTVALYLDFDGTLADIALHPDHVVVHQPLPALLLALRDRLGGAVAVVTGRPLAAVDALIEPARLAGAGLHGVELRLQDGSTSYSADPAGAAPLMRPLLERFGGDTRLLIEDKGAGVALHFRRAPERAAECIAVTRELAAAHGLDVITGKHIVEARPRGTNKGVAVELLAVHAPFSARVPVFVGDDVTDEDGFRAAQHAGGYGVKVGPGESGAHYRLGRVGEVHDWLDSSLTALEQADGP